MYNILIGCYGHETNTSTPDVTDLERFGGKDGIIDHDGTHLYNRGFHDVLKLRDDVKIIPSVAAWACPWGKVDGSTNEYITEKLLESIRNADKLDGILLSLHGAMVTTASEDGEGDLLEKVREIAGPDVPIGVMVDLHANITGKMLRNASWIINYDTYPHIDAFERAAECAELMLNTLDGKVKPIMSCIKLPLLTEFLPTTKGPAKIISDIDKKVIDMEKRETRKLIILYSLVFALALYADISREKLKENSVLMSQIPSSKDEQNYSDNEEISERRFDW